MAKRPASFWKQWLEEEEDVDFREMRNSTKLSAEKKPVTRITRCDMQMEEAELHPKAKTHSTSQPTKCSKTSSSDTRKGKQNKKRPLCENKENLTENEENPIENDVNLTTPKRLRFSVLVGRPELVCPLCRKVLKRLEYHLVNIHKVQKGSKSLESYLEAAVPPSYQNSQEECDIIEFYNLFLKYLTTRNLATESTANVSARLVGDVLRYSVEKGLLKELSGRCICTLFSTLEKKESYLQRREGKLTANYKKKIIFSCQRAVAFMTETPHKKFNISKKVGSNLDDFLRKLAKNFSKVEAKEKAEALKRTQASLMEQQYINQLLKSSYVHDVMQQAAACLDDPSLRPKLKKDFLKMRDAIMMNLMITNLIRANAVREFRMEDYEKRKKFEGKWVIDVAFHMIGGKTPTTILLNDDQEKALQAYVKFARIIVAYCSGPKCYFFLSGRLNGSDQNCCLPMDLATVTNAVKNVCSKLSIPSINPRIIRISQVSADSTFEEQLLSSVDRFGFENLRSFEEMEDVQTDGEQIKEEEAGRPEREGEDEGIREREIEESLRQEGKRERKEKKQRKKEKSIKEGELLVEGEGKENVLAENMKFEVIKGDRNAEKVRRLSEIENGEPEREEEDERNKEYEWEEKKREKKMKKQRKKEKRRIEDEYGSKGEGEGNEVEDGLNRDSEQEERKSEKKMKKQRKKEKRIKEDEHLRNGLLENMKVEGIEGERNADNTRRVSEVESKEPEREGEDGRNRESEGEERKLEKKKKKQKKKGKSRIKEDEHGEQGEGEENALVKITLEEIKEERESHGEDGRDRESGWEEREKKKLKKQRNKEKRIKEGEHLGKGEREGNGLVENIKCGGIKREQNAENTRRVSKEPKREDVGKRESEGEERLTQERKWEKKMKKQKKREKNRIEGDVHGGKGEGEEKGLVEKINLEKERNTEEVTGRVSEEDGLNGESEWEEQKRLKKLKKQRKKDKNRIEGKGEGEKKELVENINLEKERNTEEGTGRVSEEDGLNRESEWEEQKRVKKLKKQRKKEKNGMLGEDGLVEEIKEEMHAKEDIGRDFVTGEKKRKKKKKKENEKLEI